MQNFAAVLLARGFPAKVIAVRTGLSVEEIERIKEVIKSKQNEGDLAGQAALFASLSELACAFGLFASKFSQMVSGLEGTVDDTQLEALVVPGDAKATVRNLRERFVILPAFHPPPDPVMCEPPDAAVRGAN